MTPHILTLQMTPAQWANCCAAAQKVGVTISGNSGELKRDGVDASYSYDGDSTLTITILHKPLIIPEGTVENKISSWFQANE